MTAEFRMTSYAKKKQRHCDSVAGIPEENTE